MCICLKWMQLQNSFLPKQLFWLVDLTWGLWVVLWHLQKHISSLKNLTVRLSWKITFYCITCNNQSLSGKQWMGFYLGNRSEALCSTDTHRSEIHCDQKSMKFIPLVCPSPFIFPLAIELEREKLVGLLPGSCLKSEMTVITGCCSFSIWKHQNGASETSAVVLI